MSSPSGSFTMVQTKKDRIPKKRKGKGPVRARTIAERVDSRKALLNESGFLRNSVQTIKNTFDSFSRAESVENGVKRRPSCVVCLGLGSVASSSKSQDQLVLLRAILEEISLEGDHRVKMYDPAFDEVDAAYFNEINFETLPQEYDLELKEPTLLYMPHCPRFLYDQLLKKNWSIEGLRRIVLLGNALDIYNDPTHPSSSSNLKSPYIEKAASLFEIHPLPLKSSDPKDVFNDTALQWIPEAILQRQTADFWAFTAQVAVDPTIENLSSALEKIEM